MVKEVDKNVLIISVIGIVAVFGVLAYMMNGATGNVAFPLGKSALQEYKDDLKASGGNELYSLCKLARDSTSYCKAIIDGKIDTNKFKDCLSKRPSREDMSETSLVNEMRTNYLWCKKAIEQQ